MRRDKDPSEPMTEAEYLRSAVTELNQSIAYLSKMVLQLQRSINTNKAQPRAQQANQSSKKEPPVTIH